MYEILNYNFSLMQIIKKIVPCISYDAYSIGIDTKEIAFWGMRKTSTVNID